MSNTSSSRVVAFALASALAFSGTSQPVPASAFTVVCTNCSTTFQQAIQMAKEIETAINTAQQLKTQIDQYNDMLRHGRALPSTLVRRMTNDLQRLQSLYRQSKALSGGMADFDSEFRRQYKDYDSYLTQNGKNATYMQDNYARWSEEGFESVRVAMHAAGMNVSSLDDEDELLAQMVERSKSAEGRLQAIQAGNEIAAQQVQQMMKLRQLMNTQIQSQSMWYAQELERQTIDDANRQQRRATKIKRGGAKEY